jgi:hypothetical protein
MVENYKRQLIIMKFCWGKRKIDLKSQNKQIDKLQQTVKIKKERK